MEITFQKLPQHLVIIPDGNRRWAREKELEPVEGHRAGSEAFKKIAKAVFEAGIKCFTFWTSSKINLTKRPKKESAFLVELLKQEFKKLEEDDFIERHQIRINIFGEWRNLLPKDLEEQLDRLMAKTAKYKGAFLNFLVAYDGYEEMLQAIRKIADLKAKDKTLKITSELLKNCLYTRDLPAVDFVIRTGGEPHLSSGFLMWDIGDSQLYFTSKYWPDFSEEDLILALKDYESRERRFGA